MARYDPYTWFLCRNVKPPYEGEFIVTCRDAIRATVLTYENNKWVNEDNEQFDVVAWMFLPGAYRTSNMKR